MHITDTSLSKFQTIAAACAPITCLPSELWHAMRDIIGKWEATWLPEDSKLKLRCNSYLRLAASICYHFTLRPNLRCAMKNIGPDLIQHHSRHVARCDSARQLPRAYPFRLLVHRACKNDSRRSRLFSFPAIRIQL